MTALPCLPPSCTKDFVRLQANDRKRASVEAELATEAAKGGTGGGSGSDDGGGLDAEAEAERGAA
eukprot:SAG22_NODE_16057_length_334_cov_0.348936_1_plen_64_part_10